MQELNLQTTLPAVSFDAEALKSWALALTEKYNGLVVTEDAVTAVRRDMAELNKQKQALDDARKKTVLQVSEPIRQFEAQIKEVVGIFDAAYQGLSRQVKAFEEKEREAKAEKVRGTLAYALVRQGQKNPIILVEGAELGQEIGLMLESVTSTNVGTQIVACTCQVLTSHYAGWTTVHVQEVAQ